MHRLISAAVVLTVAFGLAPLRAADESPPDKEARPLVQLALLLDTSGSMSGLLEQAKQQLWGIVNEFATAKLNGRPPELQVALYHYGTPSLGQQHGFVKQLLPLTDDLDKVSEMLFKLHSDGGDEYCGWVIRSAVTELKWTDRKDAYKALFIAGNESFAQGPVDFRESCKSAAAKGIIVNTIHCAGAEDTHWAEGARLGDGKFVHIDQNQAVVQIAAPQDAEITKLNGELNKTYVAYGRFGQEGAANQAVQDANAAKAGAGVFSSRLYTKGNAQYRNDRWDLVDAVNNGTAKLEELKAEDLPEEMKNLNLEEQKKFVAAKQQERNALQEKLNHLVKERADYVAAETKKQAQNDKTLGAAVAPMVWEQAERIGFTRK
jgi:hypothetical protein